MGLGYNLIKLKIQLKGPSLCVFYLPSPGIEESSHTEWFSLICMFGEKIGKMRENIYYHVFCS